MATHPRPGESNSTLIAPELMARVRQIQIRTHRRVNTALSGGYRSTFRGQGIEFQEVRPYLPGDDVRSIDWKVTARTGEPFIKEYAEERELTLHLLVDTSMPMDFGSQQWTKREAAAQIAALIAYVAVQHQDRVGLTMFGAQPGLHLPARKGSKHILRIVREVLAAPPTPGRTNFAEVLEQQERTLHRRSLVFLISDFLGVDGISDADSRTWTDPLARLSRRHDVIAVRVFDPFEEELPAAGVFLMNEMETGKLVEVDSRSRLVRDAWTLRAQERKQRLLAGLSRARVDHFDLPTSGDLADPLIGFFRRRSRQHGRAR
jgi:uncharacterized protein (DUF58 family)